MRNLTFRMPLIDFSAKLPKLEKIFRHGNQKCSPDQGLFLLNPFLNVPLGRRSFCGLEWRLWAERRIRTGHFQWTITHANQPGRIGTGQGLFKRRSYPVEIIVARSRAVWRQSFLRRAGVFRWSGKLVVIGTTFPCSCDLRGIGQNWSKILRNCEQTLFNFLFFPEDVRDCWWLWKFVLSLPFAVEGWKGIFPLPSSSSSSLYFKLSWLDEFFSSLKFKLSWLERSVSGTEVTSLPLCRSSKVTFFLSFDSFCTGLKKLVIVDLDGTK